MRVPDELKPKSFSLNMTPMIDVVFLLIIFFLVSNNMIREEAAMKLDLPAAGTGTEIKQAETGKIVLNIPNEENLYFGTRRITGDQLFGELKRLSGESTIPLEVRIRTNKQVRYEVISPLLVQCARAGVGNVSFVVVDE